MIDVERFVGDSLRSLKLSGKRVLLIVPDSTRTAPIGDMFRMIHAAVGSEVSALDVMVALGTHPPMSDEAIRARLEISLSEREGRYRKVQFFNHAWADPSVLVHLGAIPAEDIAQMTGGRFSLDVPVTINRAALEYDHLLIVGPVFPHEVVGFSGGSKYLFPGISGPEVLNFFHWLGAVITSPKIIGHKWTPVRRVIEQAASMVPTPCHAFCLAMDGHTLADMFFGLAPVAWSEAADASSRLNVVVKPQPYHTVISCAPPMYEELWVGGKCMYKLEPVVADGGELIIYAPEMREISATHHDHIVRVGYHVRDYFLADWDRFKNEPWGTLAHSTHVKGIGTFEAGIESPRIQVTLATGIPEELCRRINLGYRDPASIHVSEYEGRENEGVLVAPNAGENLYRLQNPPEWAR